VQPSLRIRSLHTATTLVTLLAAQAAAQVVNPADKQRPPEIEVEPEGEVSSTTVTARRAVSDLREEDRIGPYGQPAWTAHRRFPSTRVYVRPPGTFGFEYWSRMTFPRDGGSTGIQTQYEFEIGLPNRFQVDLYAVHNQTGDASDSESGFDEQKFEVRYAFADWGELWGNPTAYVEFDNRDSDPDGIELKLLLGDELSPGWHWGTNLVFEHELGGDLENVYELTAGVSRTLQDERLSLGGEFKLEFADVHADRGEFAESLLVGPSLQYRPTSNVHIDLAPLVGIGHDAPDARVYFVIGYDF
jgi:hypothetical protein